MWKCKKCGEYRFNDTLVCNCREFVVVDEDGEEYEIRAMDEEGAAKKFAETVKNDEGDFVGESADIFVNGKAFRVGAELDVHYFARELVE